MLDPFAHEKPVSAPQSAFHTPLEVGLRINRLQEYVEALEARVALLEHHTHATDTPSGLSGEPV